MIWAEAPDERPYSHADYEPFWAAAQDLNMPLSLHILTARKGTGADQRAGKNFLLSLANLHHQIERSISVLVYGGVFEKYPRLRIVSAENDVGWMAYFMYRLDTVQNRLGAVGGMKLPMRASDYIKRQVSRPSYRIRSSSIHCIAMGPTTSCGRRTTLIRRRPSHARRRSWRSVSVRCPRISCARSSTTPRRRFTVCA